MRKKEPIFFTSILSKKSLHSSEKSHGVAPVLMNIHSTSRLAPRVRALVIF